MDATPPGEYEASNGGAEKKNKRTLNETGLDDFISLYFIRSLLARWCFVLF